MTSITPDSRCATAFLASPNYGERKDGRRPDAIVLHYTGMASGAEALAWLRNPASKVSCHYLVWEDGEVVQLVSEGHRAWHAGQSSWQGEADLNSASIGIEIVNPGHDGGLPAFPDGQIAAVIALCADISTRVAVPSPRVLAHSDIAPLRKRDPGENFPWDRLHRARIGHYVEPAALEGDRPGAGDQPEFVSRSLGLSQQSEASVIEVDILQGLLKAYGYGVPVNGVYCVTTEAVVRAFQRHFRPERVDGVADRSTVATLRKLIRALPA